MFSPFQKFEKVEEEDIVSSYFKPRRAATLLKESSKLDTAKVFSKWRGTYSNCEKIH